MTDAIHLPATPSPGERSTALSGLLVAESERDISIRVDDGTWTFDRSDVMAVTADGRAPEAGHRPVRVDIRPGATADFTRRLRVEIVERPITLAPAPSHCLGDEQLAAQTRAWATKLRIAERGGTTGATYTFCQTKSLAGSDDGINCDSLD
ncbi:hypothetical protein ACWEVD_06000 [Nocardia thailandica]